MKNVFLSLIILCCSVFSYGQCTPNSIFLASPVPGVYPPNIPLPNIPLTGINDGYQGVQYNETLTLIVLEDTTLDIGFLLPTAVVTAMNLAGISTTMMVDVNTVTFDVQGLPNNINYICNQSNCQYTSGNNGCISLSGTPLQFGSYPVDVNMTINIQIPQITTLFSGMAVDLPTFTAQSYDLYIDQGSSVDENSFNNYIFPNPSSKYLNFDLNTKSDIIIYNVLGKEVRRYNNVKDALKITTESLGSGVFYVSFHSIFNTETHKIIIKS